MKHLVPLAILLTATLRAQYPPDQQWQTIRTQHFDVVFPHLIEADGQRAANALETMYTPLANSLGASLPRHTVVILANENITRLDIGSAPLFPHLSTFSMMPQQDFWGTNDWITTLTVTEARHLVQIAKMRHGFGKVASIFLGEAGLVAAVGLSLPDWWIQGDAAVAQATTMRGSAVQYASSEMMTRAMLLSGEHFSYMKAMHGSFKDGVPSQEELGSFLVSHVSRTNGPDTWKEILRRTSNRSFQPFALSGAMKSVTGRSAATNYTDTMSELGELWKSQTAEAHYSKPAIVNTGTKSIFTGYYQPVFETDGSVLAQKVGMDTFPAEVVRIQPDGREQRLFRFSPTVTASNRTSVVKGLIVWDEYVPDMRWLRGYSEIFIRDLAAGHTRHLTHKTRFMNPALSPDAAHVAVVEFLPDRTCSLVILNASTGAVLQRLPSPGNAMIYSPTWSPDGNFIAMVTQGSAGRALTLADLESGKFTDLIPPTNEELANPAFFGDYVLYRSSPNGTVDIYAVQISEGRRYRVTSSKIGADFPSVSPDVTKLIYSDFTASGYNVVELPLDPATWTRVEDSPFTGIGYHPQVHDYSSEIPSTTYPVRHYNPAVHLFDVHSWGFTSGPPHLGFGIQSTDKMELIRASDSVIYNSNEEAAGFAANVSYARFFPVLYMGFSDMNRRLQFVDHTESFTERTATAGFYLPFNLSRGSYVTGLSLGAHVEDISLQGGGLIPVGYGLNFSRQRQRSARDMAPLWAQTIRLNYTQTPFGGHYTGNFLAADGRFAVPGLAPHHALILEDGYERQHGSYVFPSEILFPRGYHAFAGTDLTKYSATYEMPLLYPDLSILQAAYIKRISGNLFYDYGKVGNQLYRSSGAEAVFDLNFLHFPQPFRVGVRYAYRIDYGNKRIEPFIAFNW
jgi:Tol biopolymer transport system component